MSEFVFDTARFPLVVLKYPREGDAAGLRACYQAWDAILARGKHGVIVDIGATNPLLLGAAMRRIAAEEVERRRRAFDESLLVEARLVSGSVVRGIVTAFDWMVGRSFKRPLANFDTWKPAEEFVVAELKRNGLTVS